MSKSNNINTKYPDINESLDEYLDYIYVPGEPISRQPATDMVEDETESIYWGRERIKRFAAQLRRQPDF